MDAVNLVRRMAIGRTIAAVALIALSGCGMPVPGGGGPVVNTGRAVPVALLVPQSLQSSASLARELENAALLAAGDLQGARIDLRVYDTAGTAQGATVAAQQALDEGADIIVGPLFAEAASAAGRVAQSRGVNVLSFSNNPAIAGGNLFILGNTFQTSADRLARYAVFQGRGNVYVVHAQDPAEQLGADAIQRAVLANGGQIAGISSFPLSQQGVINTIPAIARDFRASGANALFVTSGTAGALPFLAELLPENGIDGTNSQFIGLQRLDVPSSALSLKGLQGAWFATPSPALAQQFANRYQATYGAIPNPVAGLAYDAVAAIGALVAQGNPNALGVAALTQGQGFAGVNGPFRLLGDGTNQRGLAVATIQNNQVIVIDSAPRSFGGTGF